MMQLTHDERARYAWLAGDAQTAELSEFAARVENQSGAGVHIDEARGGFIAEDFAAEHLADLHALAKRLRGENRDELLRIVSELEETRDEAARSAEYSIEELDKAAAILGDTL